MNVPTTVDLPVIPRPRAAKVAVRLPAVDPVPLPVVPRNEFRLADLLPARRQPRHRS